MIQIIGNQNSIFNTFLSEIRDKKIQQDSLRFRENLKRIGEIFAYKISKTLNYRESKIITPFGTSQMQTLQERIVIASIMRAGLPLHEGLLRYFDDAENAFISSYRKYTKNGEFKINFEYISSPSVEGKVIVLADTMLATGLSIEIAYKAMLEKGDPKHIHIVSVIASKQGVNYIKNRLDKKNATLWLGAVDNKLSSQSYIVPGCGDAGDLAFGSKLG